MLKLKIGVELAGLRVPIRNALQAAAGLGVDAVEIDARGELAPRNLSHTGLRQVRKMLDDLRLRVSAVSFHSRRGYATLDELDQRIGATKAAMDLAYQLGTNVVVGNVGHIPSEQDCEARQMLVEVLTDLGRYGQRAGAVLAAETGVESVKSLAGLLAELPEGTLSLDLNPGQLLVRGYSPLDVVSGLGRWIAHVHVSDALHGPASSRDEYVDVGRGHADFPALLGILEEHNYSGYFTVQPHSDGDPARQVTRALQYLRRL